VPTTRFSKQLDCPMKIQLFFDDVITGQDDVISPRFFTSARLWVNLSGKQSSLEMNNPVVC